MDKNAISSAFKQYAEKETRELLPIEERIKANKLPGLDRFENVKDILQRVRKGTAEDVVGVLAGEGKSLKESLDGVHVIRDTVDEDTIKAINGARLALKEMWPTLKLRLEDDEEIKKMVEDLEVLLSTGDLYDHLTEMKNSSTQISQRYLEIYIKLHDSRRDAFQAVIEEIKLNPDWAMIKEAMREPILRELTGKSCDDFDMLKSSVYCSNCRASIPQMESDKQALPEIKANVLERIAKLTGPVDQPLRVERVRLSKIYKGKIDSEESVEKVVEALREHLMKLLQEKASIILE